ncbi:hypothetical protein BDN72DRAFT_463291 [Pluteus cervinus]|uniref:Uncharacterized protein n=1 Tax=Pluteus cervinus TaxID=181527 RepID=A0ACD3B294_9AGAR|nr:hypothetical protein BDN72DRAFT_463291 [Pluteus cervinus]
MPSSSSTSSSPLASPTSSSSDHTSAREAPRNKVSGPRKLIRQHPRRPREPVDGSGSPSFKRRIVLAWKALNQPSHPRDSRRYSYMPPGFSRVGELRKDAPLPPLPQLPESFVVLGSPP